MSGRVDGRCDVFASILNEPRTRAEGDIREALDTYAQRLGHNLDEAQWFVVEESLQDLLNRVSEPSEVLALPDRLADLAMRDPVVMAVRVLALRHGWSRSHMLEEMIVQIAAQREAYRTAYEQHLQRCALPVIVTSVVNPREGT